MTIYPFFYIYRQAKHIFDILKEQKKLDYLFYIYAENFIDVGFVSNEL